MTSSWQRKEQRRRAGTLQAYNRERHFRKRGWAKLYRARILAGLEHCRVCHLVSTELTFDHLIPVSRGGKGKIDNITIMCVTDQHLKADAIWPDLISLAEEQEIMGVPYHPNIPLEEQKQEREQIMAQMPNLPPTGSAYIKTEVFNELAHRVRKLEDMHSELTARMEDLEARADGVVTKDQTTHKILAFLKQFPGVKFNAGTIGANIDTHTSKLSDRLRALGGKGVIKMEKADGHSAMFWVEISEED